MKLSYAQIIALVMALRVGVGVFAKVAAADCFQAACAFGGSNFAHCHNRRAAAQKIFQRVR